MPRPLPTVSPLRLEHDQSATNSSPAAGSPVRRYGTKGRTVTPPTSPARTFQPIRTDWLEDLPPYSPRTGDAQTVSGERSQPAILPIKPVRRHMAPPSPSSEENVMDKSRGDDKMLFNFYWTPHPSQNSQVLAAHVSGAQNSRSTMSQYSLQLDPEGRHTMFGTKLTSLDESESQTIDDDSSQPHDLVQSPRSLLLSVEPSSPAKKLRSSLTEALRRDSPRQSLNVCFGRAQISHMANEGGNIARFIPASKEEVDTGNEQASYDIDHDGCNHKNDCAITAQLERALRFEKRRNEALSRKVALYEVRRLPCDFSLALICPAQSESLAHHPPLLPLAPPCNLLSRRRSPSCVCA